MYLLNHSVHAIDILQVQLVRGPEALPQQCRNGRVTPQFGPRIGEQGFGLVVVDDERQEELPQLPDEQQLVEFQIVAPLFVFESDLVEQAKSCGDLAVFLEHCDSDGKAPKTIPATSNPDIVELKVASS